MLKYTKRITLGAVSALALAAAASAGPYDEYQGETLIVNFPAHPHFDAVMKILP